MGDAVRERRALLTAQVEAERGHVGGAIDALDGQQNPGGGRSPRRDPGESPRTGPPRGML